MANPRAALAFITVFAFHLALFIAAPLGAMSNEEFLSLLAGESGPVDPAAIRQAIAEGADVNQAGPGGVTPLMVFVSTHNDSDWQGAAVLDILLKAGAQINAKSQEGGTALSYAVLHKAGPRLVSALIQRGADVNLGVSSRGGLTPLMIAAGTDPDPVVSALLLAAGARTDVRAQKDGRSTTLMELAEQNPDSRAPRFIEAAVGRGGTREKGLPLFTEAPNDPALRRELKELDGQARQIIGADNWLGWLSYIKWQMDLSAAVELRQREFGNTQTQGWLNEYRHYVRALEAKNGRQKPVDLAEAGRPRLMLQGGWSPGPEPVAEIVAVDDRRIIIMRRPGQGALAAYETSTGRELWRYTPSALSGFYLIGATEPRPEAPPAEAEAAAPQAPAKTAAPAAAEPAAEDKPREPSPSVLVTSNWGGEFGEAAVLDAISGLILLELPPLDAPKWTVDEESGLLAVSTDYSLNLFDLATVTNTQKGWYGLLESLPWEESRLAARREQNKILASQGLELLNDQGLFEKNNSHLFRQSAEPDQTMLRESLKALKANHYDRLSVLALDYKSLRDHNFILGSACVGDCDLEALDTPLFLVNNRQNRVDVLLPEGDPEKVLTRRVLGLAQDATGGLRPLIEFSPGGAVAAVTDASRSIHFFDVGGQGRHLGSLSGDLVLDEAAGYRVRDSRLVAILDDDLSGRPFCSFELPGQDKPGGLIAVLDLAEGRVVSTFQPRPRAAGSITALAVAQDDQMAVGLEGGGLWRLNTADNHVARLDVPEGLHWTAAAFSGDGRVLLAAERNSGIYVAEPGQPLRRLALALKNIRHLAVDHEGKFGWAAAEEYTLGKKRGPAVSMFDLSGKGKPVYRPTGGDVVDLRYQPAANYAVAVEALPPPAKTASSPLKAMETTRWAGGRTDIIKFDRLRAEDAQNKRGRYDPEKFFVGLTPDLSAILYQELRPTQAFINLGLESLGARETEELESFTYQAALGPAAYSADGRLALLAERGPAGDPAGDWPFQTGGAFYVYDLAKGREMSIMSDRGRHPGGISGAAFLRDSSRAVTAGRDGSLRVWDLRGVTPVNILTWVFLENGNWAALDSQGRFDSPAPDHLEGLHWALSRTGAPSTIPLDAFMADFYQPRLAGYVLSRAPLERVVPVASRDLDRPAVKIVKIAPEKDAPGRVAVTVEVTGPEEGEPLKFVRELKLFRDNRLAARWDGGPGGLIELTEGRVQAVFRHLALPAGQTQAVFSASAMNRDRVRSPLARAAMRYQISGREAPRLHLVAVGIDQFDNPAWNLGQASADALAFAAGLPPAFTPGKSETRTLAGGQGRPRPTRANLRGTIGGLAAHQRGPGEGFTGSGPDDTVVLTISTRGFTYDNLFRLLPADVGGDGQKITPELANQGLTTAELAEILTNLDCAELILILDLVKPDPTAADPELGPPPPVPFEPGPMGDRTLALLAHDKAMRVLCAYGYPEGEGALSPLTDTLLNLGLKQGQAALGPGQPFSFKDWLNFGRARTPRHSFAVGPEGGPPVVNDLPVIFDFGGPSRPVLKGGG